MVKDIAFALFRWACNLFAGSGFGSNKVIAKLYHLVLPRLRPSSVVVNGFKMTLDKHDSLALSVFGVYEPSVGEVINTEVKTGMTVLDVGANIGYFTLMMSRLVGPTGRVYAFEPDPQNYNLLVKNLASNAITNVTTVKAAVTAKSGKVFLYIGNQSPAEYSTFNFLKDNNKVLVKSVSIDDYFAHRANKVDFIKMDIQGAEGEAFTGMKKIVSVNQTLKLLTEFWPAGLAKSSVNSSSYLDLLEKCGFTFCLLREGVRYTIRGMRRKALEVQIQKMESVNLVCFKENYRHG